MQAMITLVEPGLHFDLCLKEDTHGWALPWIPPRHVFQYLMLLFSS